MKRQFSFIPGMPKKQLPTQHAETTRSQGEQTQPAPFSQGQAGPSIQQSAGNPYSRTQQPYLHPPRNLPGIPKLPEMPKKAQLTTPPAPQANYNQPASWASSNSQIPNRPKQMTTPSPPSASHAENSFWGMQDLPDRLPQGPKPLPQGNQRSIPLAPTLPKKKRKRRIPIWARVVIGFLVFLLLVAGGALAYYLIAFAPALNNILGHPAIHTSDAQTGTVPTGRTNILLLGSDTDGKGNDPTNGTPLAQTIMIITVDPQTNYVGMLSIPRDMQVTQPGHFEPKLDEVFANGYTGNSLQDKVAHGAGAMEDIIQSNFGITIDHYAWVGLGGFMKVIDTAGGVDVDTIHPMVDDSYPDDVNNPNGSIYDYKRLYIAPGPQHLNGAQALDYVRTRHSDLVGDFGRTVRQQQIISQLKSKLATPDTIGKASELLQDLNGSLQTDMQLSDVIGLANLARNIDSNKVDRLTLGPPDYATPNTYGLRTTNYLPNCANIAPVIKKMFNIPSPTCLSQTANTGSPVAHTTSPDTTVASTAGNATIISKTNQSSTSGNTAQHNTTLASGSISLTAGVHGLLDMLFATTFESFNAMQV